MSEVRSMPRSREVSPAVFSWIAAALGLLGLTLMSFEVTSNFTVLCVWFFSNVAWIVFSVRVREWGVLAQNSGFLLVGIAGILNQWP